MSNNGNDPLLGGQLSTGASLPNSSNKDLWMIWDSFDDQETDSDSWIVNVFNRRPASLQPSQDNVPSTSGLCITETNDESVMVEGGNALPNVMVEGGNALPNVMVEGGNALPNVMVEGGNALPRVQPRVMSNLEEALESFLNNEKLGFSIDKTSKYKLEDGILFTERETAVKIKVQGAQTGQFVKVSMRFKNDAEYRKPVLACSKTEHKKLGGLNLDGTFFVCQKTPFYYMLENGHPTFFISLTEDDKFCVNPYFKCWNSCFETNQKSQEMILILYDVTGTEVLHQATFDVEVRAQVVRDSRKAAAKRKRQDEPQTSDNLQEVDAPPPRTRPRYFMVKMEDSQLVPALYVLGKHRGKVFELDPDFHAEEYFQ